MLDGGWWVWMVDGGWQKHCRHCRPSTTHAHYSPSTIHHPPPTIHHPPLTNGPLPAAISPPPPQSPTPHPPSTTHHPPSTTNQRTVARRNLAPNNGDMNTSCPYCNSAVPLPAEPPESRRLVCPRCGEAFPMPAELSPSLNGTPVAVVGAPAVPSSVNRRSRNRRLGLMIIGAMLLLAAVVAVTLVYTRSKRGLSTLAELPTLGYIPDDTNVIAAVNVPTADETP